MSGSEAAATGHLLLGGAVVLGAVLLFVSLFRRTGL